MSTHRKQNNTTMNQISASTSKISSMEEIDDIIQQYRSTLKVQPDHLEGLLFKVMNEIDRDSYKRIAIPTLAKLFELLTDEFTKGYLVYVMNKDDIANAGYLLRRLITFFHEAFNDKYLEATMDAYEVRHHFQPEELGHLYKEYQQKIEAHSK